MAECLRPTVDDDEIIRVLIGGLATFLKLLPILKKL
jgi:hypothetical protein